VIPEQVGKAEVVQGEFEKLKPQKMRAIGN
jgi:hypothetical protein